MGLANWLLPLVFATRYCCAVFFQKSGSLSKFHSLLMADWVCYSYVTVKGVAYGGDYGLEFWGGNMLGSVTEKTQTGLGIRSNN